MLYDDLNIETLGFLVIIAALFREFKMKFCSFDAYAWSSQTEIQLNLFNPGGIC